MSGVLQLLDPLELTARYHNQNSLDFTTVKMFQRALYSRYHANPRPMPWRETSDPYSILVSEIMLQQTQVDRVRSKYSEFLQSFPTLQDLARAPLAEVLTVWQGLGYNRRAIALKRCAEEIQGRFNGTFPDSVTELESMPGIGPYTARAVAAFAFNSDEVFIETNIRTVFIHYFFHSREDVHDREIMLLVDATLDRSNPREWYYALMDCGVHLKQLHPNPGRRSRHHTNQTKFEGSNRQLRSRILQAVLRSHGISSAELATILVTRISAVEQNLSALTNEGFLYVTNGMYRVAESTKKG